MTYAAANENTGTTIRGQGTLRSLCVRIADVDGGVVIGPETSEKHGRRLVAFWSGYKNRVCAGYGATTEERVAISEFGV